MTVWINCLNTLQNFVKNLLTLRRSFWCDSHPNLCVTCKRIRDYARSGKMPNLIFIFTKKGTYLWSSMKILRVVKDG